MEGIEYEITIHGKSRSYTLLSVEESKAGNQTCSIEMSRWYLNGARDAHGSIARVCPGEILEMELKKWDFSSTR